MGSRGHPSSPGEAAASLTPALGRLVARCLPAFLPGQRWFGAKGRRLDGVTLLDAGPLGDGPAAPWLALVEARFVTGLPERYALPLVLTRRELPGARWVGDLDTACPPLRAYDALDDPESCLALLTGFAQESSFATVGGEVRFTRTAAFGALASPAPRHARRVTAEQSNTSVVYDGRLILKVFRKFEAGVNPDGEVTGFLTRETAYRHVPRLSGTLEHTGGGGQGTTLALLQEFVPNRGDGWSHVLAHLERIRAWLDAGPPAGDADPGRRVALLREGSAEVLRDLRRLGELTGGLHTALASARPSTPFAPEAITVIDVERWTAAALAQVAPTIEALRAAIERLDRPGARAARTLFGQAGELTAALTGLKALVAAGCVKTRVHGDYHLGQTLCTDDGFAILDFEGEPARPLSERRAKQSPLKDVAGMLRSLYYAAAMGFAELGDAEHLAPWREAWIELARAAFLDGYRAEAGRSPVRLVPPTAEAFTRAVRVYELDKALYEVRYELGSRPAWASIPARGLARLLAAPAPLDLAPWGKV